MKLSFGLKQSIKNYLFLKKGKKKAPSPRSLFKIKTEQ